MIQRGNGNYGSNHNFWLTGIGGFLLGALTVLIVLFLARRMGDQVPVGERGDRPVEVAPDAQQLAPR